jgi:uncharacterized Zn finger protein
VTESDSPPLAELAGPDQIADLADSTSTQEGSRLASTDSVELVEVTPHAIRARVHTTGADVEVNLASSQSGIKTWCSGGAEGTLCHHAAAAALTTWQKTRHGGHWHRTDR